MGVKYQTRLTARAERDVEQILGWFQKQQALVAGARWYHQLLTKVATLEQNPQRCSIAEESEEVGVEVRELLFGRRAGIYRILFVVSGKRVEILHIRHAARDLPAAGDFFE